MIMNLEHLLPHIHILHGWKKNQCISMHCNVHLVFHCAVRRNGWRKNMSSLGHITQLGWDWTGMAQLYNTVHSAGTGSWDGSTVVLTLCSWQTLSCSMEPGDPMVPPLIADWLMDIRCCREPQLVTTYTIHQVGDSLVLTATGVYFVLWISVDTFII